MAPTSPSSGERHRPPPPTRGRGDARRDHPSWRISPSSDGRATMLPGLAEASPETQRRVVDQAQSEATALPAEHREHLESLTSALLEAETLDEARAYAAAGLDRRPPDATAEGAPSGAAPVPGP